MTLQETLASIAKSGLPLQGKLDALKFEFETNLAPLVELFGMDYNAGSVFALAMAPACRGACHRARIRATRWLMRATCLPHPIG